jgi:NAD(P)-dependent dehydrogenase (short-subunit alcohol dehydrogenase family)
MTELRGKNILVIGATGVLGSLLAQRLAEAGANLILAARDADKIAALGVAGTPVVVDLHNNAEAIIPAAMAAIVASHAAGFGEHLDGVVIAAGVVAFGPAAELTPATLTQLFAVNALGPITVITSAIAALTASAAAGNEPFVLTMSGIVAESPTAGLAAYSASKAALAAFVAATSREVRRPGIRLVDARPGHTETGLVTRALQGTAPAFPVGFAAGFVADRMITAITAGERDLPSTAFAL